MIPTPEDLVPASGALWKATRASADHGRAAWTAIASSLEAAIRAEWGPDELRLERLAAGDAVAC